MRYTTFKSNQNQEYIIESTNLFNIKARKINFDNQKWIEKWV